MAAANGMNMTGAFSLFLLNPEANSVCDSDLSFPLLLLLFYLRLVCVGQERDVQKNYWMEHSADLTVEAMMLDSKASDLDKEERPEVYLYVYHIYNITYMFCIEK